MSGADLISYYLQESYLDGNNIIFRFSYPRRIFPLPPPQPSLQINSLRRYSNHFFRLFLNQENWLDFRIA